MDEAIAQPHSRHGVGVVIACVVSLGIAFIIVAIRLITRIILVRNLGPEECAIVLSFLSSVAITTLTYIGYEHGLGSHIDTLSEADFVMFFKALWATLLVYSSALTFTKISILLLYQQLFFDTKIRKYIIVLFGVTLAYGAWTFFGNLFMCWPVNFFWSTGIRGGHCMNKQAIWFTNAGLNIATDIAILIVPIPVLNHLHLPKAQRRALMVIFGLGAIACMTSILRLKSLYTVSQSMDFTYASGTVGGWTALEVNIGIICASLPSLRATVNYIRPDMFPPSSVLPYYGGQKRFPSAQEAANWAETLQMLGDRGRSTAQVTVERKIDTGSRTDSAMSEIEDGHIRVHTVLTQVVHASDPKTGSVALDTSCGIGSEIYKLDSVLRK